MNAGCSVLNISHTSIAGSYIIDTNPHSDVRGQFDRLFCLTEMADVLSDRHIQQINHSITRERGAIRGLHLQKPPVAEMKMVRCISGSVWDVVVDLRRGSPTLRKWESHLLSKNNSRLLVIPEGCAHGFQVLEENSELIYLHTASYDKSAEWGVNFADQSLAIDWPLPVTIVSDKDRSLPFLDKTNMGIEI